MCLYPMMRGWEVRSSMFFKNLTLSSHLSFNPRATYRLLECFKSRE
jgi:hypothetical protein